MSSEAVEIIQELGKQFGIAVDWTATNVLPYIQELASRISLYQIVSNLTWLGIWTAVVGVIYTIYQFIQKYEWEFDSEKLIASFLVRTLMLAILVIAASIIAVNIVTYLCIPEKALIDFISSMK